MSSEQSAKGFALILGAARAAGLTARAAAFVQKADAIETGRYGLVRERRDRRLDVHGWERNEGKLFRPRHPQEGPPGLRRFGLNLDF